MQRVLIIEHDPSDIQQAHSTLKTLGVENVQSITTVAFALEYLRDLSEGRHAPPDLVILDLEFGRESGFEVLRYWKGTPQLKDVRIVVWTHMGELEQRICRMFGVTHVIDKRAGVKELENGLREASADG